MLFIKVMAKKDYGEFSFSLEYEYFILAYITFFKFSLKNKLFDF